MTLHGQMSRRLDGAIIYRAGEILAVIAWTHNPRAEKDPAGCYLKWRGGERVEVSRGRAWTRAEALASAAKRIADQSADALALKDAATAAETRGLHRAFADVGLTFLEL